MSIVRTGLAKAPAATRYFEDVANDGMFAISNPQQAEPKEAEKAKEKTPPKEAEKAKEKPPVDADTQAGSRQRAAQAEGPIAQALRNAAASAPPAPPAKPGSVESFDLGPLPGPRTRTFPDAAAAKAALEKEYGVTVKGDWKLEELTRMHEGWALMGKEKATLRGTEVVRGSVHVEPDGTKKPSVAGLYSYTSPRKLTMYDNAFADKGKGDEYNRRYTMDVALHEAGHGVDNAQDLRTGVEEAVKKMEKVSADMQGTVARATYGATESAQQTQAGQVFLALGDNVDAARAKVETATTPQERNDALRGLRIASNLRDQHLKNVPVEGRRAAQAWAAQQDKQAKALETAQKSTEKHHTHTRPGFAEHGGDKGVTPYGKGKVGENYADAYSLFRRDPEWLKANARAVYDHLHATLD